MRPLLISILLAAAMAACSSRGDLNTTCEMVKRDAGDPNGLTATPLLLSDIPNTRTDFISFGSPDCDDRICVRDFQYVQDGGAPFAFGYCSSPCTPGAPNQCPSYDGSLDNGPNKLNCRALLLDAQTLAAICGEDGGAECTQYFSNTRSPYFCARGNTPDGG
jgi:hypothetical protein